MYIIFDILSHKNKNDCHSQYNISSLKKPENKRFNNMFGYVDFPFLARHNYHEFWSGIKHAVENVAHKEGHVAEKEGHSVAHTAVVGEVGSLVG
jgi:hypothetical protein